MAERGPTSPTPEAAAPAVAPAAAPETRAAQSAASRPAAAVPTPSPATSPSSGEHRKVNETRDAAWGKLQAAEAMLESPMGLDLVEKHRLNQAGMGEDKGVSEEELRARVTEARRGYSKATLEMWRKGSIEKLSPDDLQILVQDLTDTAERSAIAEMIISRHGFANAQEMFRKIGLKEVEVFGQKFSKNEEGKLEAFWKSPAVREQLTKLGISGGTSLTAAGVITLLGGPVSLAAIGLGIGGAALGRLGGEGIRKMMLSRKVDSKTGDGKVAFNEQYGREIFEVVMGLQSQAKEIQEMDDKFAQAEAVLELLKGAGSPAMLAESHQSYKRTERGAAWIKGGLSVIGAVGGNLIGNSLIGAAAEAKSTAAKEAVQHQIQQAHEQGVWILHDSAGHAQLVPPGTENAHFVKEQADHLWHFGIQQHDANQAAASHLSDQFHYYTSPDQQPAFAALSKLSGQSTEFLTRVPLHLPAEGSLYHLGVINDVNSAFSRELSGLLQQINHDALFAQCFSGLATGLGLVASEGLWNSYQSDKSRAREKQVAKDDRTLIGSIDEVEEMLRDKMLLPYDAQTNVGTIPEDLKRRQIFFERLADFYHVPIPTNPNGYSYDWNKRPAVLNDPKIGEKTEVWHSYDPKNGGVQVDPVSGKPVMIGVLGIDADHNRIAIVHPEYTASGVKISPITVQRLDLFLSQFRPHMDTTGGTPLQWIDIIGAPGGTPGPEVPVEPPEPPAPVEPVEPEPIDPEIEPEPVPPEPVPVPPVVPPGPVPPGPNPVDPNQPNPERQLSRNSVEYLLQLADATRELEEHGRALGEVGLSYRVKNVTVDGHPAQKYTLGYYDKGKDRAQDRVELEFTLDPNQETAADCTITRFHLNQEGNSLIPIEESVTLASLVKRVKPFREQVNELIDSTQTP